MKLINKGVTDPHFISRADTILRWNRRGVDTSLLYFV